ncbi:MAG: FAD-dependent oxidoreductase [Clostridia bacterium]|nr:FAD-dependent oxidoreductase [Clostridia bacterium]
MKELWKETVRMPHFLPLTEDLKTDVLIIGGGLAGLLTAWRLEQAGVSYALIESNRICSGATGRTTAKITALQGAIYQRLVPKYGSDRARAYYEANQWAVREYERLCGGMDCDFEHRDAYLYAREDPRPLLKELTALQRMGLACDLQKELPLPFATAGGIRLERQAQFNPLKFAAAIARGLNIYEHTTAQSCSGDTVQTIGGQITAKRIVVATHFPFLNRHGAYFMKLYQQRSYVLGLEGVPPLEGMFLEEGGLSLRSYGNVLLLGGGSHRTGKPSDGWDSLLWAARAYFPGGREQYRWANQDCISLDGMPYIGRYAKGRRDLYVASGFNKWGMTGSMLASRLLADLILEKDAPYRALFAPPRGILHGQLAVNLFESTVNLLRLKKPRCSHMGCALQWNPHEQSWDCPCHGSRFDAQGELLENPAMGDLKKRSTQ